MGPCFLREQDVDSYACVLRCRQAWFLLTSSDPFLAFIQYLYKKSMLVEVKKDGATTNYLSQIPRKAATTLFEAQKVETSQYAELIMTRCLSFFSLWALNPNSCLLSVSWSRFCLCCTYLQLFLFLALDTLFFGPLNHSHDLLVLTVLPGEGLPVLLRLLY